MDSYTIMEEEYSTSGCESGWTVYFEQSSRSGYVDDDQGYCVNRSEEEEEDLSMVSDASSGPAAQVTSSQDNNKNNNNTNAANCCSYDVNNNGGRMFYSVSSTNELDDGAIISARNKQQQRRRSKKKDSRRPCEKWVYFYQDHLLDDTASSRPDFNYSSRKYDDQAATSMRKMMDFSQDHFSTSYFPGAASSSTIHTHDHQVHFHQQYNEGEDGDENVCSISTRSTKGLS